MVLRERITTAIPQALTPRCFTSEILQVNAVPRTLCGEKIKTPFKRLMLGESAARVLNPDAVASPEALAW